MLKNKQTRYIFIRSFSITLVLTLMFAGGAMLGWRSFVQPPTVPTMACLPANPTTSSNHDDETYEEPAFDIVDPHPEDALINMDSPIVFTDEIAGRTFLLFLSLATTRA